MLCIYYYYFYYFFFFLLKIKSKNEEKHDTVSLPNPILYMQVQICSVFPNWYILWRPIPSCISTRDVLEHNFFAWVYFFWHPRTALATSLSINKIKSLYNKNDQACTRAPRWTADWSSLLKVVLIGITGHWLLCPCVLLRLTWIGDDQTSAEIS